MDMQAQSLSTHCTLCFRGTNTAHDQVEETNMWIMARFWFVHNAKGGIKRSQYLFFEDYLRKSSENTSKCLDLHYLPSRQMGRTLWGGESHMSWVMRKRESMQHLEQRVVWQVCVTSKKKTRERFKNVISIHWKSPPDLSLNNNKKNNYFGPGWCGSVHWVWACKPNGRQFDSQSGHMPGLLGRSPVRGAREATTHWCFSPSLSPSLLLSLKVNK